jgi:separase
MLADSAALTSLLQSVISVEAEAEVRHVAGKIDRALERLRRSISSWLDRLSATSDSVSAIAKAMLVVNMEILASVIQRVNTRHITTMTSY